MCQWRWKWTFRVNFSCYVLATRMEILIFEFYTKRGIRRILILSSVAASKFYACPVLFHEIFPKLCPPSRFTEEKTTLDASTRYRLNVRCNRHAPIAQRRNDKEEISKGAEGEKGWVEENKVAWFINNSIWSWAFVERHLRRRSRVFLVSSISSSLYSLHFRAEARSVYVTSYFFFGYAFGIVIYFRLCDYGSRALTGSRKIWRGKRSFHNHYRVLKGPSFVAAVSFPFATISIKILTGLYIYIDLARSPTDKDVRFGWIYGHRFFFLLIHFYVNFNRCQVRTFSEVSAKARTNKKMTKVSFDRLAIEPSPIRVPKKRRRRFYSWVFPSWRIDRLTINSNHTGRWLLITNKIFERCLMREKLPEHALPFR